MAAVSISWGAIPLIVRSVDLPDLQLVASRVWLGAFFLAPIAVRATVPTGMRWRVGAIGILLAAHWGFFFIAISNASVATALVLIYMAPLAMAAFAGPVLQETIRPVVIGALLLSVVGLWLVIGGEVAGSGLGIVAGLTSAAALAAFTIIGKPLAQAIGGLRTAALQVTTASIVLIPWAVAAVVDVPWEPAGTAPVWTWWWQVLVLGVFLTGFTIVINWWVLTRLPVATTSVLYYLEPASAALLAALVLGERPTTGAAIGIALVLVAGASVGFTARARPAPVR